jgi:hypothetical protein
MSTHTSTDVICNRLYAGGTRCCIHTPGLPLQPDDLTPKLINRALDGAALVFFDGRLTEAALLLAAAAQAERTMSHAGTVY